jgi:protein-S-isoprenylcysteine O-methyltransferase Ste14
MLRCLLLVMWIAWFWPFVVLAPHGQKREHTTVAGPTRIGLLLEFVSIMLVGILHRAAPPAPWRIAAAVVIAVGAIVVSWASVRHLGKQFRIHAGLYHDHELVRSGPYALVRHPIYASLFAMLVANILLLSGRLVAALAIAIYIVGTEIRVRTEDRLLASRFRTEFDNYRRQVPAYIPFVR